MSLVVAALAAAALRHRILNIYAPLNVLVRRVKASSQTVGIAALLIVLTANRPDRGLLLVAVVVVSTAAAAVRAGLAEPGRARTCVGRRSVRNNGTSSGPPRIHVSRP